MNKEEKIKTILNYLNSRMSVMSKDQTETVKKIVEDDDISLQEVVEWYIDYVWRSA
jgi:hypothetical protein